MFPWRGRGRALSLPKQRPFCKHRLGKVCAVLSLTRKLADLWAINRVRSEWSWSAAPTSSQRTPASVCRSQQSPGSRPLSLAVQLLARIMHTTMPKMERLEGHRAVPLRLNRPVSGTFQCFDGIQLQSPNSVASINGPLCYFSLL